MTAPDEYVDRLFSYLCTIGHDPRERTEAAQEDRDSAGAR